MQQTSQLMWKFPWKFYRCQTNHSLPNHKTIWFPQLKLLCPTPRMWAKTQQMKHRIAMRQMKGQVRQEFLWLRIKMMIMISFFIVLPFGSFQSCSQLCSFCSCSHSFVIGEDVGVHRKTMIGSLHPQIILISCSRPKCWMSALMLRPPAVFVSKINAM